MIDNTRNQEMPLNKGPDGKIWKDGWISSGNIWPGWGGVAPSPDEACGPGSLSLSPAVPRCEQAHLVHVHVALGKRQPTSQSCVPGEVLGAWLSPCVAF